jgi:hypothetical protein
MTVRRTGHLQKRTLSLVRRAATQVYIFSSVGNSSVRAFTFDATPANLPIAYAPWRSSIADTALPTWGLADSVMVAIQRDGFFLVHAASA